MNTKLIISALLSLMAVQVSYMSPSAQSDTKAEAPKKEITQMASSNSWIAKTDYTIWTNIEVIKNDAGNNELRWTTSDKTSSESFLVQRSEDGHHFKTIGRRSPLEKIYAYSFEDAGFSKAAYYRIIEVDVNGNISYSKAVKTNE